MGSASDNHAREMMLDGILSEREREPLPDNPPPEAKWQAKQGMARLPLNGAEYAVLACLIDRASKNKGACYPSQEFISAWTFRPLRTVRRAIETLSHKGLIRILHRGTTSNAYLINWPPLFAAYRKMKTLERRNAERNADASAVLAEQKVAGSTAKSGQEDRPKVAAKPMKRTYEEKPMTLSASSNDEAYLIILNGGKEEGLQRRGEVESASTNSQHPEGPSYHEASERVVGYCKPFHWDHLTQEEFDAAVAAEMVEVGAGRAVVDGAANKTWQEKRKGKDQ